MKFYLLRHGQTDWNLEGKLQGRKDIPMNGSGREQMLTVAEHLKEQNFRVDLIVSGPLDRAAESAKIVAEQIAFAGNIIYDDDFIERSFGLAEGLIWNSEMNLDDEQYGTESVEDICERAEKAIGKYMCYEDKNILIVAHGAILSALKSVLSQGTLGYYDSSIPIIQGKVLCCEITDEDKRNFYYL